MKNKSVKITKNRKKFIKSVGKIAKKAEEKGKKE